MGQDKEASQEHREFRQDKTLLWLDSIIMANVLPLMVMNGAASSFTVKAITTTARGSRSPMSATFRGRKFPSGRRVLAVNA